MIGARGTTSAAVLAPAGCARVRWLRRSAMVGFAGAGLWLVAGLGHTDTAHAAEPVTPAGVLAPVTAAFGHTVTALTTPAQPAPATHAKPLSPVVKTVSGVVSTTRTTVAVTVHRVATTVDRTLAATVPGVRPVIAPIVAPITKPVSEPVTIPVVHPVTSSSKPVHVTRATTSTPALKHTPIRRSTEPAKASSVATVPAAKAATVAHRTIEARTASAPTSTASVPAAPVHAAHTATIALHGGHTPTSPNVPTSPVGSGAPSGNGADAGSGHGGSAYALVPTVSSPRLGAAGAISAGHLTAPREQATAPSASPD